MLEFKTEVSVPVTIRCSCSCIRMWGKQYRSIKLSKREHNNSFWITWSLILFFFYMKRWLWLWVNWLSALSLVPKVVNWLPTLNRLWREQVLSSSLYKVWVCIPQRLSRRFSISLWIRAWRATRIGESNVLFWATRSTTFPGSSSYKYRWNTENRDWKMKMI